jgi:glycerol-3-phosphate O-acyltransferase
MTQTAADTVAVLTAQDALVLLAMDTPVETQLLMDWLGQQRARNPDAKFDI